VVGNRRVGREVRKKVISEVMEKLKVGRRTVLELDALIGYFFGEGGERKVG